MRAFLETTFGPAEFEIVRTVLDRWRNEHGLAKSGPDVELAGAIIITLFREGYRTIPELLVASARHKGLSELAGSVVSGHMTAVGDQRCGSAVVLKSGLASSEADDKAASQFGCL